MGEDTPLLHRQRPRGGCGSAARLMFLMKSMEMSLQSSSAQTMSESAVSCVMQWTVLPFMAEGIGSWT